MAACCSGVRMNQGVRFTSAAKVDPTRYLARCLDGDALDQPTLAQAAQRRAPTGRGGVQPALVARLLQQRGQRLRLARAHRRQCGAAGFGQAPAECIGVRQRLAATQGGRQRSAQHLADRRVQVAGQPMQRGQQLAGQQWRIVEQWLCLPQFHAGLRRAVADDDADRLPAAERHPQALPRRHRVGGQAGTAAGSRTGAAAAAAGRRAARQGRRAWRQSSRRPHPAQLRRKADT